MSKGFEIAAVGDIALLHPPTQALYREPWDRAAVRIANLEAPLTETGMPAAKLIRLKSPPQAAGWLAEMGCQAVSLANNHIMDWGAPGLCSTLEELDRAKVGHAGAGMDQAQAQEPAILEQDGKRIALLGWACTIPPGFGARQDRPGLAGIRVRTSYAADASTLDEQPGTPPWVHTEAVAEDVEKLKGAIQKARAQSDFVLLALHWGVPPQWQSRFQGPLAEYQGPLGRALIEAGADVILGCHAHTVFGMETVQRQDNTRGVIVYSLGNYIFHPLAHRLELDAPLLPYHAEERPENSETYVASFSLAAAQTGRLEVAQVRLCPAHLDAEWESIAPSPEQAHAISDRVAKFCEWRGTPVKQEGNVIVWSSGCDS